MQPKTLKNLMAVLMIVAGAVGIGITFVLDSVLSAFSFSLPIETWVMGGLEIAMGVGLLRGARWARWLAAGYCFLAVVGAVIVTVVVLALSQYIEAISAFFLFGRMPAVRWMIYGAVLLQIGYGCLAWFTYKYLQSEEGFQEFGQPQPHNARAQMVYAALLWIVLPLVLPASYRMSRNPSPEQAAAALMHEATPRDVAELAERGFLTADGQHMVFMGKNVKDLYLLDLRSGKLTRDERHPFLFSRYARTFRWVAPDASAIIYPDGTLEEWPGGRTRKLSSVGPKLNSGVVGFVSGTRLLVHQDTTGKLELIDTRADKPLWSASVTGHNRDPSFSGDGNLWAERPMDWSPRRDQLAWSEQGHVFVASLTAGSVREVAQVEGTGAYVSFSPDGSELLVSPIESNGRGPQPNARIVKLATGESTEVPVAGLVLYFGGAAGEVVTRNGSTSVLTRQFAASDEGAQHMLLPHPYALYKANGRGFVLGFGEGGEPLYAITQDATELPVWRFNAAGGRFSTPGMTPDGRSVVLVEGTRVHLYDTASLVAGTPKRRSIDLTNEKMLSAPQSIKTAQVTTLMWEQPTAAASETESAPPAVTPAAAEPPALPAPAVPRASASPIAVSAPADAPPPPPANPNRILKCRDAAGAVSFVKGYCPPGTTSTDALGGTR